MTQDEARALKPGAVVYVPQVSFKPLTRDWQVQKAVLELVLVKTTLARTQVTHLVLTDRPLQTGQVNPSRPFPEFYAPDRCYLSLTTALDETDRLAAALVTKLLAAVARLQNPATYVALPSVQS